MFNELEGSNVLIVAVYAPRLTQVNAIGFIYVLQRLRSHWPGRAYENHVFEWSEPDNRANSSLGLIYFRKFIPR